MRGGTESAGAACLPIRLGGTGSGDGAALFKLVPFWFALLGPALEAVPLRAVPFEAVLFGAVLLEAVLFEPVLFEAVLFEAVLFGAVRAGSGPPGVAAAAPASLPAPLVPRVFPVPPGSSARRAFPLPPFRATELMCSNFSQWRGRRNQAHGKRLSVGD